MQKNNFVGTTDNSEEKNRKRKRLGVWLYWLGLFPVIVFMLAYFVIGVVRDYHENPYATRIVALQMQYFPGVSLCPKLWFNKRIAKTVLGDMSTLSYVLGFNKLSVGEDHDQLIKDINRKSLQAKYDKLVKKYGSHSNLMKAIAQNPRKLLGVVNTGGFEALDGIVSTIEFVADLKGVCFRIPRWPLNHRVFEERDGPSRPSLQLLVNISYMIESLDYSKSEKPYSEELDKKSFDSGNYEELENEDAADRLLKTDYGEYLLTTFSEALIKFGSKSYSYVLGGDIQLAIPSSYRIYLDLTSSTKLTDCSLKVKGLSHREQILSHCVKHNVKECVKAGQKCIQYAGADTEEGIAPLCHALDKVEYQKAANCTHKARSFCQNAVKYPCEEVSINGVPVLRERPWFYTKGTMVIKIFPQGFRSILHIEEVPNRSWSVLVSNIGGLFGVFLGASFLSLADAFRWVVKKVQQKKEKAKEKAAKESVAT